MINIKRFCFNPMQTNCYVVSNENHAVIIDPCCYFDHEKQELDDYITSNNLKVEHIFVTHMHVDHILGLNWCQKKYDVIAEGPSNENHWVEIGKQWAKQMGYNIDDDISPLTKFLSDDDSISFGDWGEIQVVHTPGHSPGHLSYIVSDKLSCFYDAFFCGDVVFENGIGRYDFPDSDYEALQRSIKEVKTFPAIQIYPGHGESFSPEIPEKFHRVEKSPEELNQDRKTSIWKKMFGK